MILNFIFILNKLVDFFDFLIWIDIISYILISFGISGKIIFSIYSVSQMLLFPWMYLFSKYVIIGNAHFVHIGLWLLCGFMKNSLLTALKVISMSKHFH